MLKDKTPLDSDSRNLSDVFKELQQMQYSQSHDDSSNKKKTHKLNMGISSFSHSNFFRGKGVTISNICILSMITIIGLAISFPNSSTFKESYAKEESLEEISEYELNRHRLNIQNIISENSTMDKVKEQVIEEREIEFETKYNNNSSLPKNEEIIMQEGVNGKEAVTAVKTYENGNFIEEIILGKKRIQDPVEKVIDLGTSEFLAKHKVHIGDTMYLTNNVVLKDSIEATAKDVAEVKKSLDVKLLELPSEDWCKVSFDSIEGYIKTTNLTSSYTTPNILEKNRIQRILIKININMELNKSSGLTLNDYKKIFTGLSNDTKGIFYNNYSTFYNIDKKYNINGIFLASMAIHESAWGTSQIANDKKNLFGYGAYDNTPYESSYEFEDYSEGIELVAKCLVKYYLNPSGTKIYDGEKASAWYYNGPTLAGVNTRYASDKDWHTKVYSYMEMLYNRLSK